MRKLKLDFSRLPVAYIQAQELFLRSLKSAKMSVRKANAQNFCAPERAQRGVDA